MMKQRPLLFSCIKWKLRFGTVLAGGKAIFCGKLPPFNIKTYLDLSVAYWLILKTGPLFALRFSCSRMVNSDVTAVGCGLILKNGLFCIGGSGRLRERPVNLI